jgi:hypothetical protein
MSIKLTYFPSKYVFGICYFVLLFTNSITGQNGIVDAKYFLLKKTVDSISINIFTNNKIEEVATYPVTIYSGFKNYTTDGQSKFVKFSNNYIYIYDFLKKEEEVYEIGIPMSGKECILLYKNKVYIGGRKDEDPNIKMLVEFDLISKKWFAPSIPPGIDYPGKKIDDLLVDNDTIIAIDDMIYPKYILFYQYQKDTFSKYLFLTPIAELGSEEVIYSGRIENNFIALYSKTRDREGGNIHLVVYDKNYFEQWIDANEIDNEAFPFIKWNLTLRGINFYDKEFIPEYMYDFGLLGNNLLILTEKLGLTIWDIRERLNYDTTEDFEKLVKSAQIKMHSDEKTIESITLIPQIKNKVILTILDNRNKTRTHEILDINPR